MKNEAASLMNNEELRWIFIHSEKIFCCMLINIEIRGIIVSRMAVALWKK